MLISPLELMMLLEETATHDEKVELFASSEDSTSIAHEDVA
jgi:hypothetical protein